MGNIEYITLLLYWLVKSNDCRDIQEVRLRIIFCQRKYELSVLEDFQKSRSYISNKKYHTQKKESKDCGSLWRFSSYRLISYVFVFYREVFCILFLLGIFSYEKIFSCFFGRFATSGGEL